MPQLTPNLWFDTEAEEAAEFDCSVFPNSKITSKSHYPENAPREAGMVMTVEFELDGQRFTGINGGPDFKFDEAVSFLVNCEDQDEIDTTGKAARGRRRGARAAGSRTVSASPGRCARRGWTSVRRPWIGSRAERAMQAMLKMRSSISPRCSELLTANRRRLTRCLDTLLPVSEPRCWKAGWTGSEPIHQSIGKGNPMFRAVSFLPARRRDHRRRPSARLLVPVLGQHPDSGAPDCSLDRCNRLDRRLFRRHLFGQGLGQGRAGGGWDPGIDPVS